MTKEKMQKAQELDSKISSLDIEINTLEHIENSTITSVQINIFQEYGKQTLTFLKSEFDIGFVFRDLLEMCREKRDRLKDEFLQL